MAKNLNDPMTIVQMVANAGPPLRYNAVDDPKEGLKKGTYDCLYCGPTSLPTLEEASDECKHGEECPWRLAKELVDRLP